MQSRKLGREGGEEGRMNMGVVETGETIKLFFNTKMKKKLSLSNFSISFSLRSRSHGVTKFVSN